jgi:hypothetical protein
MLLSSVFARLVEPDDYAELPSQATRGAAGDAGDSVEHAGFRWRTFAFAGRFD